MKMECKAFCSAVSYQMKPLYKFLKKNDQSTENYGGAIYTPINKGHAFLFPYGCVVFWRLNDDEIAQMFKKLRGFEEDHLLKANE